MKKLTLVLVILGLLTVSWSTAAQESTPVNQALYIPMRDGVQIAVDVWLPSALEPGQQVPTLMKSTRYWRAIQNLDDMSPDVQFFTSNGYAVVLVDVRGTGASEGVQTMVWSDDEVADLGEVIDWIVGQPWSNGRVGSFGVSYEGNLAEVTAVPNHPALKAIAPLFDDFDPFAYLAMPGGVFGEWFISNWQSTNEILDTNDLCALAELSGMDCESLKEITPGVKNVDADADRSHVNDIIQNRTQNVNVYNILSNMTYRDDPISAPQTISEVSPFGRKAEIESSGVPMFVQVSWMDAATVEGALNRYMTFSNPQKLVIGAWSHGGQVDADPFQSPNTPAQPSTNDQYAMLLEFFDTYVKGDNPQPAVSEISYYTMNAGTWTTTTSFPPTGFDYQSWYLGENGSLSQQQPTQESGSDEYTVDFTTTTGTATRWHTQEGGTDVVYPDRAQEDEKLLTYTSAPLESAVEITGNPIVTLYVSSTAEDGALHVYLEDVSPDGHVTYITEGILRAIHRQTSEDAPYSFLGVYHSYNQADGAPLVAGEVVEMKFNLYATSVLIEQGHQIRLAIAAADAGIFARYPAEGTPLLKLERNTAFASKVEIPMIER